MVDKGEKATTAKTAEAAKGTSLDKNNKATTSDSAFSSSGIAGFASQASPFLQAGTKPLSSFASSSSSKSPLDAAAATSKPSVFGGNNLSNGASPFGQVGGAPKPFGTIAFGGTSFGGSTFGSKLGGSSLTSFGKPGQSFKSSKPAKPFGAPASEGEDSERDEGSNSDDDDRADNEESEAQEDKAGAADDKKKPKLQRGELPDVVLLFFASMLTQFIVNVDDGEAGEATLLSVRAKIYYLDKASSSWKERGAGNLKINVPSPCVDFDEVTGQPIIGTFDASGLEDAKSKIVRLIMRQDSTHRVILNTAIIPAMEFQEKSTVKATCVLFTAIEDEGAVSIQLKVRFPPRMRCNIVLIIIQMNAANAKNLLNEVGKIQRELQSV